MSLKQTLTQPVGSESFQKYCKTVGQKVKKIFVFLSFLTMWISAGAIILFCYAASENEGDYDTTTFYNSAQPEQICNVSGIVMHGGVLTYIPNEDVDADGNITVDEFSSESVVQKIREADKDTNIKAILVEIDSYGGSPVAGEEIARALKEAMKPTVALLRDAGASAAYMAATGADRIFASKNSDVGSIGATMSYLDNAGQNTANGLSYNQLSSGKFKDTGSSDKKLTAEEKSLLMRDVNITYENFIDLVAANRNMDETKVRSLADGSTMMGEMALENGLIDQIGDQYDVEKYLRELIGENTNICW
ncbi:MAG: signal peptide peptidase SppA [Patescibacteria group bacterium]